MIERGFMINKVLPPTLPLELTAFMVRNKVRREISPAGGYLWEGLIIRMYAATAAWAYGLMVMNKAGARWFHRRAAAYLS